MKSRNHPSPSLSLSLPYLKEKLSTEEQHGERSPQKTLFPDLQTLANTNREGGRKPTVPNTLPVSFLRSFLQSTPCPATAPPDPIDAVPDSGRSRCLLIRSEVVRP
ncbi:hypothetical protein MLD38_027961 [Melastoma candidum]|uniref:Uncharacterized protein n=1 Tax=Melastoma candidum TaxID=119954 RepID=A0ACB9N158_9MYRT|nr:hypothetical protein MLD38_027961 [Melastoma candidum]